jgi:nucleoside-diphosphate-sugar epimerase
MARAGEAVSRLIKRPPLLGSGQLTFMLWQARASNDRARSELGVEFAPLSNGVARTVRWMAQTGRL